MRRYFSGPLDPVRLLIVITIIFVALLPSTAGLLISPVPLQGNFSGINHRLEQIHCGASTASASSPQEFAHTLRKS
ncbi:hypothetical protein B0I35DRAFT_479109 [Stachybotrys elegans]|uniref:Uncharacterized protein n=1 Tax=Stachybotrys elegans TaxID=80388 RepID=A0A8K0WQR4_9HYPO|nr:hypothetical protein B0I35DRAFT_479109 [Stachybotrys elegans]